MYSYAMLDRRSRAIGSNSNSVAARPSPEAVFG
jgi:hypothetical protein